MATPATALGELAAASGIGQAAQGPVAKFRSRSKRGVVNEYEANLAQLSLVPLGLVSAYGLMCLIQHGPDAIIHGCKGRSVCPCSSSTPTLPPFGPAPPTPPTPPVPFFPSGRTPPEQPPVSAPTELPVRVPTDQPVGISLPNGPLGIAGPGGLGIGQPSNAPIGQPLGPQLLKPVNFFGPTPFGFGPAGIFGGLPTTTGGALPPLPLPGGPSAPLLLPDFFPLAAADAKAPGPTRFAQLGGFLPSGDSPQQVLQRGNAIVGGLPDNPSEARAKILDFLAHGYATKYGPGPPPEGTIQRAIALDTLDLIDAA